MYFEIIVKRLLQTQVSEYRKRIRGRRENQNLILESTEILYIYFFLTTGRFLFLQSNTGTITDIDARTRELVFTVVKKASVNPTFFSFILIQG